MSKKEILFLTIYVSMFIGIMTHQFNDEDKLKGQYYSYVQTFKNNAWYFHPENTSFRDVVLKQKLKDCMNDSLDKINLFDVKGRGTTFWTSVFDKQKTDFLFKTKESSCSQDVIQTVALSNQEAGSALTYYLIQKNVTVPEQYKKFAKQNDIALASIALN
jgi:hypothetical protein